MADQSVVATMTNDITGLISYPGLAQHTFSSGFSNSILLVRGGTFAGIASSDWPIKRFYLPCIGADVEALQRDF